jgi:(E)-4-hydroxy-3-methylbut-2-enyl-diphosphate synthase
MFKKRISRRVVVGGVPIGGGAPVSVQSMTNTDAADAKAAVRQIRALARRGADIVRVAVPNRKSAAVLPFIVKKSPVPLVADVHFRPEIALLAIDAGIHKIRLNPGNMSDRAAVRKVLRAAKDAGIPIRIGANSGSIASRGRRGKSIPELMVAKTLDWCRDFEREGFRDIVLSLKASSVPDTIEAYRIAAKKCAYPLHLGVTSAGLPEDAVVKSAVAFGALLAEGIGDTVRVSSAGSPLFEVDAAFSILGALGLRKKGVEVIACPTCGRTKIDVVGLARKVKRRLAGCGKTASVAVMGCEVNGPGEAADADCGVAGGRGFGILFVKGEQIGKIPEDKIVDELVKLVNRL